MVHSRAPFSIAALFISTAWVLQAGSASAGTQDGAAIALHVKSRTTKGATVCTTWRPTVSCSNYVASWPIGVGADVYLSVVRAQPLPGIAGLSCGIDYAAATGEGVDVYGYTLCGDMDFTNAGPNGVWPAAGGGNRIVWLPATNCQMTSIAPDGVHAIACALYVYAYGEDVFRVIPNANLESLPELRVADCSAAESRVPTSAVGAVSFSTAGASAGCNPCVETCDEGSACYVYPAFLDFGAVTPGESLERIFTIHNQSTVVASGTVGESCPDFDIVSGGGFYTLLPGQSRDVAVRFTPLNMEASSCIVSAGDLCRGVSCAGNAGQRCALSPESLSFGGVALGEYAEESFTITSTGSIPLQVNPTSPCGEFSIVSGGGSGQLELGASRTVVVRYTPTTLGNGVCSIQTGSECASVPCAGTGLSRCWVNPTTVSFGSVLVGESLDRSFTITNTQQSHSLPLNISAGCTDFTVVAGGGVVTLLPGETCTVTVRFTPGAPGSHVCEVVTGSPECALVTCSGSGHLLCTVSPSALDFGTVPVGYFGDRAFWIYASGGALTGDVTLAGEGFSLLSGGGHYSLAQGDSRQVVVRFQPTSVGPHACTIETGNSDCGAVAGAGESASSVTRQDRAVIALHAKSHTMKASNVCLPAQEGGRAPTNIPCTEYATNARTRTPYDVYIMVARVEDEDGISGAAFGINYGGAPGAGVDVFTWMSCVDNEQPGAGWPASGSGLTLSWSRLDNCQRTPIPGYPEEGAVAAVGALYVYAYGEDVLGVVERQDIATRDLSITDCNGVETLILPHRVGIVYFSPSGTVYGFNPCTDLPPLAASVMGFTASRAPEGAELRWRATGIEADHAGFDAYREVDGGERVPLEGPVAVNADEYTFLDSDPPAEETRYWLAERSRAGAIAWFGPAILSAGGVGGPGFRILSVGPSPFATASRFAFRTAEPGAVTVRVFDALGREVARPHDGTLPAGPHDVAWDGRTANGQAAPTGVYLYRIETPAGSASGKIVLIHGR